MTPIAAREVACLGDPRLPVRFWAKVSVAPNGCWLWQGAKKPDGYARFWFGTRAAHQLKYVHRFAYERLVGPILAETLDHLCRTPHCVNPAHLEPVSNRVNVLRGNTIAARNIQKTHCVNGHPLSGANLRSAKTRCGVHRVCRVCHMKASKKYRARIKSRAAS